jgi:hypothetical protein
VIQAAEGRERETQIEDDGFKKVAREPNCFKTVFSPRSWEDPKGQNHFIWFCLLHRFDNSRDLSNL